VGSIPITRSTTPEGRRPGRCAQPGRQALASNLLERGIRVNAVAPGPVWTPLNPPGSLVVFLASSACVDSITA